MSTRFALCVLGSVVLLIVDIYTPVQSFEWVGQVLLVWAVAQGKSSRSSEILWAGVLASLCIFAGTALSLPTGWALTANHLVAVAAIWVIVHYSRKRRFAEEAERRAVEALQRSLEEIKVLRGLLPICAGCKRIRTEAGDWEQMEVYIRDRSEAEFTHTLCEACARRLGSL